MTQSYWFRVLRSLDRLGNAVTGGDDEETISHRVARAWKLGKWWGCHVCWWLDKWKYVFGHHAWEDHCLKVLLRPNPSDSTIPLDAPLKGDANREQARYDAIITMLAGELHQVPAAPQTPGVTVTEGSSGMP